MAINLSPILEDYLESILILQLKNKIVRVKDLALVLKVKASSVNEALASLKKTGLVIHEKYGSVELSKKGTNLASKLYKRHQILTTFLNKILGIKEEIAKKDACKIEHYLSIETVTRIVNFIKFIETCPKGEPEWLDNFHYYALHGLRQDAR